MVGKALVAWTLAVAVVIPVGAASAAQDQPVEAAATDTFDTSLWAAFTPPSGWQSNVTGDFNGDGIDDVASFNNGNGTWWVSISDGDVFNTALWADFVTTTDWTSQIVGDFNGDGYDDIGNFNSGNGTWWVSISDGTSFTTTLWDDFSTNDGWQTQIAGDFNGDKISDIANFHPSNGTWWVSISDGSSFTTTLWDDFVTNSGWQTQVAGDFNNDNVTDIANFHPSNGTWWVSISDGSSFTTTLWADFTTTSVWTAQIVGDFNGDWYADIANFNSDTGTWWVSLSDGSSFTTALWADYETATGWQTQVVGDFNRDDVSDIANFNSGNGTWWVSISDGTTFSSTTLWAVFTPPSNWVAQIVGDYNGDGIDGVANFSDLNGTWWVSLASVEDQGFLDRGVYSTYQNPFLAPNDNSQIHQNSFFTDVFTRNGPVANDTPGFTADYLNNFLFRLNKSDGSESVEFVRITECASVQFDEENNAAIGVCGSVPDPETQEIEIVLLAIDMDTYRVLGFADLGVASFTRPITQDFGVGAYSYIDQNNRPVVVGIDCHVRIFDADLDPGGFGAAEYEVVADWNVCGTDDSPNPPAIDPDDFAHDLNLFALLPDGDGNIWFSVQQGLVGTIVGGGSAQDQDDADNSPILFLDLWPGDNDRERPIEQITNSNSVSDTGQAHFLGTIHMYQFGTDGSSITKNWEYRYDNVERTKPGQVSPGGGTSPTIFQHGGSQRFVAFTDNGDPMNVVVLDTADGSVVMEEPAFPDLGREVANENSLIGWTLDNDSANPRSWVFAENNYGNNPCAVLFEGVTSPGFVRFELRRGKLNPRATSRNETISIPSVVTQASGGTGLIYTYNKKPEGWFFTSLDPRNVNDVVFEADAQDVPVATYPPPEVVADPNGEPGEDDIDPSDDTVVNPDGTTQLFSSVALAIQGDDCKEELLENFDDDPGIRYNNTYSAVILGPTTAAGVDKVWIGMAFGMWVVSY